MQDGIRRGYVRRGSGGFRASVEVSRKAREIAAGDFQAQPVALQEDIARGPQIYRKAICLSGIDELRLLLRIPVSSPDNSLRQVSRKSIRSHIDELRREIRVHRRGFHKKLQADRPRHFHIVFQGSRGINEDVVASFHGALIARPGLKVFGIAAQGAARGWRRIGGVVDVMIERLGRGRGGGKFAVASE